MGIWRANTKRFKRSTTLQTIISAVDDNAATVQEILRVCLFLYTGNTRRFNPLFGLDSINDMSLKQFSVSRRRKWKSYTPTATATGQKKKKKVEWYLYKNIYKKILQTSKRKKKVHTGNARLEQKWTEERKMQAVTSMREDIIHAICHAVRRGKWQEYRRFWIVWKFVDDRTWRERSVNTTSFAECSIITQHE